MRTLLLRALFLLPACAPTMADLSVDANSSGEWTTVNERVSQDVEHEMGRPTCRTGFTEFCVLTPPTESCSCAPNQIWDDRLEAIATRRGIAHSIRHVAVAKTAEIPRHNGRDPQGDGLDNYVGSRPLLGKDLDVEADAQPAGFVAM